MQQLKELSCFFRFFKFASDADKRKMKKVCQTRCVEQVTDMDTFEDLFIS